MKLPDMDDVYAEAARRIRELLPLPKRPWYLRARSRVWYSPPMQRLRKVRNAARATWRDWTTAHGRPVFARSIVRHEHDGPGCACFQQPTLAPASSSSIIRAAVYGSSWNRQYPTVLEVIDMGPGAFGLRITIKDPLLGTASTIKCVRDCVELARPAGVFFGGIMVVTAP